tara:strand:+ start:869 stop:1285 length:417 start_codon:yes stop_codon:yes gene_type:complete
MDKNKDDYLNININYGKPEVDNKPQLIAPNVKFFFKNILKNCNTIKNNNYNFYYNIGLLILFIVVLGTILLCKYKGGKNSIEKYHKNLRDKQYIMSKLIYYNKTNIENNQRIKNNMITNLPDYSNHPEAELLHKKIYF